MTTTHIYSAFLSNKTSTFKVRGMSNLKEIKNDHF